MQKVTFSLFGKEYTVNCGDNDQDKLREVVSYVEGKTHEIVKRAGNATEHRLLMLTCLLLADELLEMRRRKSEESVGDEDLIIAAVEHLRNRVTHIASQVGRA